MRAHFRPYAVFLQFFSHLLHTMLLSPLMLCFKLLNRVYIFFTLLVLLFVPDFSPCVAGAMDHIPNSETHSLLFHHLFPHTVFYWKDYLLSIHLSAPQQVQCPAWGLCSLPESHRDERRQGNGNPLPLAEEFQPICVSAAAQFQGKGWVLPGITSSVLLNLLYCL